MRLSWASEENNRNDTNTSTPNLKTRNSQPEEHKDLEDLLGDSGSQNINAPEPNLNTRHSHTQNIKQTPEQKDPFADIDFSKF
mmetsp:Transcript_3004/g.3563  ORF Transcript_3004/g.3563 Transcript_3004/m.3563 type:complete len:83 (+) Transcript_3004:273-521(+)